MKFKTRALVAIPLFVCAIAAVVIMVRIFAYPMRSEYSCIYTPEQDIWKIENEYEQGYDTIMPPCSIS